jgi:PDZ domain-containing protein
VSRHDDQSLGSNEGAEVSPKKVAPSPRAPGEGPLPSRRHVVRPRHYLLGVVVVLLVAIVASSLISVPYYAITPGQAQDIAPLIKVPAADHHRHDGQILLVDVELVPLRAIEWLWYKLNPNDAIEPNSDILGPETAAQYETEGILDMDNAQQAATVVALKTLGYKVSVKGDGALVYAVFPNSPASTDLAVGQVITSIDNKAVNSNVALSAGLVGRAPGSVVRLGVMEYGTHKHSVVSVRLGEWRISGKGKNATLACPPFGTETKLPIDHIDPDTGKKVAAAACLGLLDAEDNYAVGRLPVKVNLSSEGIIGPSAGLAFTLGLMQQLDPENLTGGHRIAATGTMSITGAIGDVGGVAQKTIAVRDAGVKIFFVPPEEYSVAKAHAGSTLKIYKVSSIGQVLRILQRYGGKVPASR